MGTMIEATTTITNVSVDLSEDGARRLHAVLQVSDLSSPEMQRLHDELADLFGTVEAAPEPEPEPDGLPPIVLEIPRRYAWNVFILRSHIYKYLGAQFAEYLSRPEDIKISYAANQEALGLA